MKYSIVICAYNAESRLPKTLEHLAQLDYDLNEIEVILVDNASTDGTSQIARSFWKKLGEPIVLRIEREERIGKSFALWRAYDMAVGKYVLTCDDDNWLASDYLRVADRTYRSTGEYAILGGASTPVMEAAWEKVPPYFYSFSSWYAVGTKTLSLKDITVESGWVNGAGTIYPRSAIMELKKRGFVQLLSCRSGTSTTSGGDVELCYALSLLGCRIYCQPELNFYHFIPSRRLQKSYLEGLFSSNESEKTLLYRYDRMRLIYFSKSRLRSILSAIVFVIRNSSLVNREALIYTIFGKAIKFKELPVYLVLRV